MHFPIIAIEDLETPKEEWCTDLPYDDPVILENTDYAGGIYSEEERDSVIQSEWLQELFRGYAVVDPVTESLYFADIETVKTTWNNYLKELTKWLYEEAQAETLSHWDLCSAGKEYNNFSTLFVKDGCACTSLSFIYYFAFDCAGKTVRIGNIFDAHT